MKLLAAPNKRSVIAKIVMLSIALVASFSLIACSGGAKQETSNNAQDQNDARAWLQDQEKSKTSDSNEPSAKDITFSNVKEIQPWTFAKDSVAPGREKDYGYAVIAFDVTNNSDHMVNFPICITGSESKLDQYNEWVEVPNPAAADVTQTYWDLKAGEAVTDNHGSSYLGLYLNAGQTKHFQITIEASGHDKRWTDFNPKVTDNELYEVDDYLTDVVAADGEITVSYANDKFSSTNNTSHYLEEVDVFFAVPFVRSPHPWCRCSNLNTAQITF